MRRVILSPKTADGVIFPVFNFQMLMDFGEVITAAATTCIVISGTDPNPLDMIEGDAVISGYNVTQEIIGGVSGVTYFLTCVAAGVDGNIYTRGAYLAIVPSDLT